jgi:hypothetical protein
VLTISSDLHLGNVGRQAIRTMRHAVCGVFILFAATAAAQNTQQITPTTVTPASNFDVLVGVIDVLHFADMLTTSYDLTHPSRTLRAIEGNPVLRPFSGSPARLAAASGALTIAQVMVLRHMNRKHPKLATVYLVSIVAVKMIAVTSNVRMAGMLQAARNGEVRR